MQLLSYYTRYANVTTFLLVSNATARSTEDAALADKISAMTLVKSLRFPISRYKAREFSCYLSPCLKAKFSVSYENPEQTSL